MPNPSAPYHPIIYVRGFALSEREQDETTADPFCGFNLGATVYRATPEKEKPAKKFVFESPVLRLISEYQYAEVYENGLDIVDVDWEGTIPTRSIVIYRYYEQASALLGTGKTPEIADFAKGLSQLILRVRDLVCARPDNGIAPEDFRCYLVAHSMGGLIVRAFLQNPELGDDQARHSVDKIFTYATPHNGIDMAGLNVPKWLSAGDMNNFNRDYMAKYLNLEAIYKKTGRVDWVPEETFPSERFFCMVGSNRGDYDVAMGLSRTFAGHGSDGLVAIDNASIWGTNTKGKVSSPCATAYAYRSHSGYFGIVNSEESYQNLTRFLFGDVRVDIWVDVESVQLPPEIQGQAVNALYQFELPGLAPRQTLVSDAPRGGGGLGCLPQLPGSDGPGEEERKKPVLVFRIPGESCACRPGAPFARLRSDPRGAGSGLRGRAQVLGRYALRGRIPVQGFDGRGDVPAAERRGQLDSRLRLAEQQPGSRQPVARLQDAQERQAADGRAIREQEISGDCRSTAIRGLGMERLRT